MIEELCKKDLAYESKLNQIVHHEQRMSLRTNLQILHTHRDTCSLQKSVIFIEIPARAREMCQ